MMCLQGGLLWHHQRAYHGARSGEPGSLLVRMNNTVLIAPVPLIVSNYCLRQEDGQASPAVLVMYRPARTSVLTNIVPFTARCLASLTNHSTSGRATRRHGTPSLSFTTPADVDVMQCRGLLACGVVST